ncbi:MAG: cyanophycinase [Isosphaeraceae bacterium]|nr:cyanophycinase [Isosphaeraceae bacterium]
MISSLLTSLALLTLQAVPAVGPKDGALVIVGGGKVGPEIVARFVELAGGPDAEVVLVPTPNESDTIDAKRVRDSFAKAFGLKHVTVLHTRDKAEADTEGFVAPLKTAKGVWITGGRQWRLVDSYLGTRTQQELEAVLARGGVIGGTSAGATIQGSYLVRGAREGNRIMMAKGYEVGFGYLRGVAVDQHLITRKREEDLVGVIEAHPELLGLGIDESTAVVVRGDRFEVIGQSKVAIYDGKNHGGKRYYFLAPGDRFDLRERRPLGSVAPSAVSPDPDRPRPIAGVDTVFLEDMTWMEVRDALKAGKTTAIVATGGVEQNGPYLVTGKHNLVLKATTDAIARKLGNALVAPIIAFVPEGDIEPPTAHMKYPGTISLTEDTYQRLLVDVCASLRAHGFTNIVLIGDSGGNQAGMKQVARVLNARWTDGKSRVHFIPEYYDHEAVDAWLQTQGINQVPEGIHDDFALTATIMTVDPKAVRADQRIAAGKFRINGVDLAPAEKTVEWGRKIVDFRAGRTVEAIRKSIEGAR